ncbi:hypothetical protein [Halomonas campaniensis]|uniref:Uncharacterized protein n=1 Tax=Halomonas campaniensis TaxID=213554 RepID=A0A246RZD2_9GAMM|nr:hypothetical protein [Halomonas campaniensis]OWV29446.1 hypothetical protein JI62_11565 [Halomonas campaniensis]
MIDSAHGAPVDRQALRVGFFPGEHFEVEFTEDRPKRRITLDAPPRRPKRPKTARDYTGLINGRMTALFWLKPTGNGQSSYWVVRCDCGKYEIRKKLGKWHKKHGGEDMCEVCEREREMLNGFSPKASRRTQGERLLRWVDEMRQLGLNDAEITAIRCNDNLDTKGKTVEEIRQALE